ncbi:hypothetical protein FACS1894201_10430 [Bacteroidia bacterium]|nr:hypothetical protein FACS1894201_10430 [Bacteroidia bacterium]
MESGELTQLPNAEPNLFGYAEVTRKSPTGNGELKNKYNG